MMDAKIRPLPNISPSLVLTHAYLMLLDWSVDERGAYPEVRDVFIACCYPIVRTENATKNSIGQGKGNVFS